MNRALTLTIAASALWALAAVWVYDCKIKRVCGPGNETATIAPLAEPPVARPAARRPDAPAAAVAATPLVSGVVLRVSFDARSAALLPPADAEAGLETLRQGIAQGQKVRVLGHSDGRGARTRIVIVSQQRAEALRDWLLVQGIPASAIATVESREDREPIASNNDDEGRRKNRRAEALLTAKE